MMLLEARTVPVKLWLVAAEASDGERPADQGQSPSAHLRPLRVLIVEDEFFIALDIEASLMALGHASVGIAVSGDEAVSVAGRERPDVVLMDIRLVGARDGIDAAEEIFSRYGIRCLFVTANADDHTRQRAAALNPFGFLEKPLTMQRLEACLAALSK